jgi:hypothetical protein
MRAKNLVAATVILFGVLHLSSCSSSERAILGKWQEIGGTETMEFFKDGTISVTDFGMSMAGKYSFIETNRMKIELGGIGAVAGPMIVKVEISGKELVLTDPKDKVSKYRKVE